MIYGKFFKLMGFILISYVINAQVGIGNSNPNGIIDVTNDNHYPVVLPAEPVRGNIKSPKGIFSLGSLFYNATTQCIEIYNGSAWDSFCKDSTNAFSFVSESYFEIYETVDFFHIVKTENGQGKVSFKMIDS
ncbi:MAG: hypothetical protein ACK5HU_03890, partial [Flavobacteriales bacterium]